MGLMHIDLVACLLLQLFLSGNSFMLANKDYKNMDVAHFLFIMHNVYSAFNSFILFTREIHFICFFLIIL